MSRNRLHKTKLDAFRDYLETKGWTNRDPRGEYEVLRMTHPMYRTLIVHTKLDAVEHYTMHGISEVMFGKWKHSRREAKG